MSGEHLDLSSDLPPQRPNTGGSRPFLGIRFACCDVYARIYLNARGTAYQGYCPRCSKAVMIRVGPGGSDARFFTAY